MSADDPRTSMVISLRCKQCPIVLLLMKTQDSLSKWKVKCDNRKFSEGESLLSFSSLKFRLPLNSHTEVIICLYEIGPLHMLKKSELNYGNTSWEDWEEECNLSSLQRGHSVSHLLFPLKSISTWNLVYKKNKKNMCSFLLFSLFLISPN